MPRLGPTLHSLAAQRRRWRELMRDISAFPTPAGLADALGEARLGVFRDAGRLTEVTDFGANPGGLQMFVHAPAHLPSSPALVVILHGCAQTAAGYDFGTGWSALADRYGFVVLAPQQRAVNNPKACFNWFLPGDTTRGRGEAASIRAMVEHAIVTYGIDRKRVFITGLSAGGAMTSVMLATYPDVFTAGAIIAGLPYGAAGNVQQAFEAMFQGRTHTAAEWGDHVRAVFPYRGRWPRVSVWHGSADATVVPSNAHEIVKQWANVHGLDPANGHTDMVDGFPHEVWRDAAGERVIESYTITDMAHGVPLSTKAVRPDSDIAYGVAGPFLLEAGISSSYLIAKFFGLTEAVSAASAKAVQTKSAMLSSAPPPPRGFDVGAVIAKALRAAGLMKSDA
ncbi:MAG: PHB depolymerase family esterase [Rhizobiales bacterium]|nr:PHB depolymerase family esterase [Hyphomicrobiales bacterium]